MADITAIILTRNEEEYIEDCIASIKPIVKRIVLVDSFSDDKTVDLARDAGAEVHQHEFFNYAKQYMYAVEIANVQTKWILRIAKKLDRDITINLRHIMDFGDGDFEIRILNNNIVVHNMAELVSYAGYFIGSGEKN